eukprot:TRINITY_DN69258_c0_g1_i1.p2 TRINITY_DN69258_c0_g1~~TRINITY_DN69258_c0_g1_i1.p2  ORF type:complete len:150 (+),score=42.68 TRINITY_DN69258_c0_g1_i1:123-572(+)
MCIRDRVSTQSTWDRFDKQKGFISQERFYAKINNEMKGHLISEAFHNMSLKKNYSLKEIEDIMHTFHAEIPDEMDEKALRRNINKVLAGPSTTSNYSKMNKSYPVSYTHLRAHETSLHLVCRLLLEKKKKQLKIKLDCQIRMTDISESK